MCDAAIIGIREVGNSLWDAIEGPCSSVIESYDWLGREVTQLASEYISPSIGPITQKIFNALPVTVALLVLPKSITAIPVAVLLIAGTIAPALDDLIGRETRKNIYRGVSDSEFFQAGAALVSLAVTGNMAHLTKAVFCIFGSVLAYMYSETN